MICPPVAYWNISLWSSSCSTIRHFMRKASHWRRSLKMYDWISNGVASISVEQRHNLSGCPSPTFLWATSINASNVCIEIHPLDFSRPSLIVALVHSYKYLHSGQNKQLFCDLKLYFLELLTRASRELVVPLPTPPMEPALILPYSWNCTVALFHLKCWRVCDSFQSCR